MATVTVMFKIDEENWWLLGCEGVHEASAWKCKNCPKPQRKACISLLNKHPDLRGKAIQFPFQDKVRDKGLGSELTYKPSWKEINDRFARIEERQYKIKDTLEELDRQWKEWKRKYPG